MHERYTLMSESIKCATSYYNRVDLNVYLQMLT